MVREIVRDVLVLGRRSVTFNDDKSPNVQTFLSGFYRKTLNPDAFGPPL